jgi:Zn-dependent protease
VTFWAALNVGPLSRPLEALLGYLAILNAALALLHALPAWPFDAGWLARAVLMRIGVKRRLAGCVLLALGAVAGCVLVLIGARQVLTTDDELFGTWTIMLGALVISEIISLPPCRVWCGHSSHTAL